MVSILHELLETKHYLVKKRKNLASAQYPSPKFCKNAIIIGLVARVYQTERNVITLVISLQLEGF